jgi:hypothetical protein
VLVAEIVREHNGRAVLVPLVENVWRVQHTATYGIRVNTIEAGTFDTPMTAGGAYAQLGNMRERVAAAVPLQRPGAPAELAAAVPFCCRQDRASAPARRSPSTVARTPAAYRRCRLRRRSEPAECGRGFGVLGAAKFTPEELEIELSCEGLPGGR